MNVKRRSGALITLDTRELNEFKLAYTTLYNKNCVRINVDKYWLLSIQLRTMLIILYIEKTLDLKRTIVSTRRITGYTDTGYFKTGLRNTSVFEFSLERFLAICDYVGISWSELKQKVLKDLMQTNEQQKEKIYGKINKQYSPN